MQWERKSLYKQISQVTGVSGKHISILRELKGSIVPEALPEVCAKIRKTARGGDAKAQCVMGFLCCIGYAEKRGRKNLNGGAVGRLDAPRGAKGQLFYAIGDDYFPVTGEHQDLEEAAYWYRRSAAHGLDSAQMLYGDCLFSGEGVEPDIGMAISLYFKSYQQGNAYACRRLGDCSYLGIGMSQDMERAVNFFRKAARLGCRDALWRLGDIYYQGEGVERNAMMAEAFYEDAAEAGVASAMCMIGDMYFYGVHSELAKEPEGGRTLDGKQIRESLEEQPAEGMEDYEQAVKWYKKSARREDEWGLFALGMCFYFGKGVTQSYKKAVKYFLRAAAYGCPDALWRLASCYYNGIGTKKNKKKAYKYYRAAVELYGIYGENDM
ncbi:MAG: sel1 repeat family protein [Eubacterium sp.]|nr:sel1 repeat family protein [Eubacterium sp.]